jgi:hypothetical protein
VGGALLGVDVSAGPVRLRKQPGEDAAIAAL